MFSSFVKFMFQDSASPLMYYVCSFHDHVMVVVFMILSVVFYVFFSILFLPLFKRFFFKVSD